jgi:SAM-dependent methyltransferase
LKASVQRLLDTYYPLLPDGSRTKDGTKPFYDWFLSGIDARNALVLNVGAGPTPTPVERCLRGRVKRLIGVDPDPIVGTNTDLDEAYVNDGLQLPFPDGHFDAVYSDWTLEHVPDPIPFLNEVHRVLKPGAFYWFRTTNLGHYVTFVSARTPQWFHRLVANRARQLPHDEHDPWPTRYRMNTQGALRRALLGAGFESAEIRIIESWPGYLVFNPLAFRVGVVYERLVNRFSSLARFRLIMIGRAQKAFTTSGANALPYAPPLTTVARPGS